MANKRYVPRARKRIALELNSTKGFTADLSPGGFAVELPRALPPGTSVQGALEVEGERFDFTGQIAWARAGEPRLGVRARMGVRFTGIANAFFTRCASLLAAA